MMQIREVVGQPTTYGRHSKPKRPHLHQDRIRNCNTKEKPHNGQSFTKYRSRDRDMYSIREVS